MVAKIAGGSGVLNDALGGAGAASQDLLAAAMAAGYLRPSQIGAAGGSFLPTLSRQQMENDMLINTRNANTQQYSAEQSARLGSLNLLAGLRGPANAIRYNYMLNKTPVPAGELISGTSAFTPSAQPNPSTFPTTMPPVAAPPAMLPNMGLPTAPKPAVPAVNPVAPLANTPPAQQLGIEAGTLPTGEKPVAIDGTKVTYAGGVTWDLANGPPPPHLSFDTPGVGYEPTGMSAQQPGEESYDPSQGYQEDPGNYQAIEDNANEMFQPDASGQDFTFSIDESGSLIATPNAAKGIRVRQKQKMDVIGGEAGPEIVTGSDFTIHPMSKLKGRPLPMAAEGATVQDGLIAMPNLGGGLGASTVGNGAQYGVDSTMNSDLMAELQRLRRSQIINSNYGGGTAPAAPQTRPYDQGAANAANSGQAPGALDFTQYSQQDIANLPALQKLRGERPANAAFGTGLDTRIPGTSTSMPTMLNLQRWARMLPSERLTVQDLYETPAEMGGLGLDWGDIAAFSQRAAPLGAGLQTQATYGR